MLETLHLICFLSVLATIDNLITVVIKYVVRFQTPRILLDGRHPPVTSTRCVSPIGGRRMRVREHQGMLQSRATEYRVPRSVISTSISRLTRERGFLALQPLSVSSPKTNYKEDFDEIAEEHAFHVTYVNVEEKTPPGEDVC